MLQPRTFTALAAVTVAAAVLTVPRALYAQEDDAFVPQMPAPPTKVHEKLQESVGEWNGTIDSNYPGMPPMKSAATETVTSLGPYHTVSRFSCDFMGMPYEGLGTMGYDPETETMHGTWTDSVNTYHNVMKGKMDLETGTVDMIYEAPAPDGSGLVRHRNHVQLGKDQYSIHFYMGAEGDELHFMTLEMKRKK
ncbi:MAG: DUF1579 family protein [Planctomycetota bacterium]